MFDSIRSTFAEQTFALVSYCPPGVVVRYRQPVAPPAHAVGDNISSRRLIAPPPHRPHRRCDSVSAAACRVTATHRLGCISHFAAGRATVRHLVSCHLHHRTAAPRVLLTSSVTLLRVAALVVPQHAGPRRPVGAAVYVASRLLR